MIHHNKNCHGLQAVAIDKQMVIKIILFQKGLKMLINVGRIPVTGLVHIPIGIGCP